MFVPSKREMPVHDLRNLALLVGRFCIVGVFIWDATSILQNYAGAVAYAESSGVPGIAMPLVVLLQLGGGILIALGWWTRPVALVFAGFCALTALTFHRHFGDTNEIIQFGKDIGLTGGFLFLFAAGAGDWSFDERQNRR